MSYVPLASAAGRVHVCAHRGHSIGAPENTLPALVEAAKRGATVAEIDVVLTADDEVVLLHDEILDRTTSGKGRAAALTLAEIRALDAGAWFSPAFAGTRVPTLAEALAEARRHGMGLLVEIKERQRAARMIERLAAVLTAERAAGDVLVISFDHVSLVEMRRRLPEARTELITHARHVDIRAVAERAGAASVAIEADMFHPDDGRALHDAGVAVRVTLPRPDRIAARLAYGLDIEGPIREALGHGLIDVLAGDDTDHIAGLVTAYGRLG
ncbi:glycerophosphodiester phosphodiesterase [Prosthecomicrobium sp. N25]|uniref:glycerophosphodiester phosphodiesterase n=1 Tax=Prosthecomicrobium sp. N25 TaxID=3129254 RepID=UPI003078A292